MNAQTQGHHPKAEPHPFTKMGYGPIFDEKSKVLILGSFPSESSKKAGFYYGDKNNQFWIVLGDLLDNPNLAEQSKDEKRAFLLKKQIALWDIWAYCYKIPENSPSDKDIQPEPDSQKVDLTELFAKAKEIQMVFTTIGGSFKKWGIEEWLKKYGKSVIPLYSTSATSIRFKKVTYKQLRDDYEQILKFVK